jgi:seryl-tRNA synthetase
MLDIKLLREQTEIVRKDLERRQDSNKIEQLDEFVEKDKLYREKLQEMEKLKQLRNQISKEISELKKNGKDAAEKLKQAGEIPGKMKNLEDEVKELKERCRILHMGFPNMLHESVPYGKDDTENVEIKRWGEAPKFDFVPKDHVTLAEDLGIMDRERATKTSGAGFIFLKGKLAILDYALMRFAMDFMVKRGYTMVEPPLMLKRKPYEGVTDLADFEDVMYKIEGEDLYLIATSEHAVGAMMMDETINEKDLPMRFCGVSPCFRKEVGSHGKYTKGLFRMHNFNKIEQFVFCKPEESWDFHAEILKNSEELFQALNLHYRVVNICTGDIGIIAAKKYDIEVWMADGKFRETHSASNCTDYQARRLNVKYREKEGAVAKGFVHTLNNTCVATSRALIAILEQYQQADGSIKIPEVLVPYTGFKEIKKGE